MSVRDTGPRHAVATASQTVGPFFHFGLAAGALLGRIAPGDAPGERLSLRVRVVDGDGAPVPDALIELYQADSSGRYGQPAFDGFGRLATDADGVCAFETVRPGAIADGGDLQAPHINVCLFARGLLRHIYTRIYFHGDAGLDADPVLAVVPADRRQTLLATPVAGEPGAWHFPVRLQGHQETVFFDL
jgi:protocatechuate 3,4-dioxygenase alpha subunit